MTASTDEGRGGETNSGALSSRILQAWIKCASQRRADRLDRQNGKAYELPRLLPAIEELVIGWSHGFAHDHIGSRLLATKTEYRQKSYGPDGVAF
jgi:hypothetical protein